MARPDWPKWSGGPTLEQYADLQLRLGDDYPFDGEGGGDPGSVDAGDWATRAARGIISELGDRGAAFNEALHPEKVDHETRIEIVEVMAEIIRRAADKGLR